jgi:Ni/Co efflux regulator RcnB
MKKLLLIIAIAAFSATTSFAQTKESSCKSKQEKTHHRNSGADGQSNSDQVQMNPEKAAERRIEMLNQKITLSNGQQAELKKVFAEFYETMKQQGHNGNKGNNFKVHVEARDEKVKNILDSEDQYKAYWEFNEEMKAQRASHIRESYGKSKNSKS